MPRTRQTEVPLSENLERLENLPQPVVAHGRELACGETLPFHRHRRAQLVYASRGVMTVTTRSASYIVPPQRAVWMPAGTEHRIDARSDVSMRTLYIEPAPNASLARSVAVLQVTPLLRELVVTAVAEGPAYPPHSPQSRLASVILERIGVLPEALLDPPLPVDSRLLRIAGALIENPGDQRDLGDWSGSVGASKRTLSRLFTAQTGMSFRVWRQRLRLLRAVELLAAGESVTAVSLELGYEHPSAFIAMFRRCLGTTPKRYADRAD